MTVTKKKKIIMSAEQIEAPVGAFFLELGWEIANSVDKETLKDCEFILDDYLPEIVDFPRVKTDPSKKFALEIEKCVRGTFDINQLKDENVRHLLKIHFKQGPEFDFIDRYSMHFKQVFMLKIHDFLNIGYFIDSMVIEAYKAKFNHELIRSFLNEFIVYGLKQVEYNENQRFIEVTYAISEHAFVVQANFEKKDFSLEQEVTQFNNFKEKVNYYDVNYFSKRKHLTLSTLWFKDNSLKKFRAQFYNETTSRVLEATTLEIKSGLEPKEDTHYDVPDRNQGKKLTLARKIALFIKNYRTREEGAKPAADLEIVDVENYMSFYPRQEALAEIDDELKIFILKLLKDETFYAGISDMVKKIADSGLEDYSNEIQKILSNKSLSDIEETLKIHGKQEDVGEGFTRIQGQAEEQDNFKQVIRGVTQDLGKDEKWEIKKGQISEKIKEEVFRIKSEGRNVIQDDIVKIVSGQLEVEEEDVKIIIADVIEEAIAPTVVVEKSLEAELTNSDIKKVASDAYKEKLESQIGRMKKVIEQMRLELLKLREEKEFYSLEKEVPAAEHADNLRLKNALTKTMNVLKGKEKFIEKMHIDYDTILKKKDHRMHELEAKIESMKSELSHSPDQTRIERLRVLEIENKNLVSKLEMANKRIHVFAEKNNNRDIELHNKKDKELESLNASVKMAQALIERFKSEKVDIEIKLISEREAAKKVREELESKLKSVHVQDPTKFTDEIHSLTQEKRNLEDKNKLQAIELKKLEQKLKFTNSQLDSAQKRKGNGTPSAGPKSNEAYLKQLESANHKLAEASEEMGEKKKEILKLKQENTIMTGKIAELERKLALAEKKAA